MFLKKDGITQNNKLMFIGTFVFILIIGALIIYKNLGNKERIAEEQRQVQIKMTAAAKEGKGLDFFKTPIPGTSLNAPKEEKDAESNLNSILSKNSDKKKLLFFFASWNKESIIMLENIKKIATKVKDTAKVIAIEVEGSSAQNLSFKDSLVEKIKCTDAIIPAKYLVDAVPTIVVLSKNNAVSATKKGSIKYDEILNLID